MNLSALGRNFVTPLLLSPVIAVIAGATLYGILRALRLWFGVGKEMCVCIGTETQVMPVPSPDGVFAAEALPKLTVTADEPAVCLQRYTGSFLGINASRLVDGLHFLSAGAVSFARGLNDTPKVAALRLVATTLNIQWGLVAIAMAMAVGGLLNARKVADIYTDGHVERLRWSRARFDQFPDHQVRKPLSHSAHDRSEDQMRGQCHQHKHC